jgi:hypothetical protein
MPAEFQNDQAEWARKTAADNATNTYNTARANNETEQNALAKAKFAWQQVIDRAGLTGKFEDAWTMPTQQWFTTQFGTWNPNGPTPGQQTLAGQQQGWQQAYDTSQMYGQYYAPGSNPEAGQQTQAALGQQQQNAATVAGLTGYYNMPGAPGAAGAGGQGQQTLAGQQQGWSQGFQQQQEANKVAYQNQQTAQQYLQLLSSLRGPADWAKYQQVLGSTPGGMSDLVAAAMGQYVPGGGATTGYQPQAANLQTMMGQVQQYAPSYQQQGGPQFQTGQWNPQQQQGQAWGSGIGVGGGQTTPEQQQQAQGGGTNMYGAQGQQQQPNLPAPNQIAAQSWKNMAPSQQQMMLGQYEAQGWDKNDVQSLMAQALPRYGSNAPTAGTWSLR